MTYLRKRAGARAITALLKKLTASGGTYVALCKAAGLSHAVVAAYIREMRNAHLVFVGQWVDDVRGIPSIPVFHWGPFRDVPRPPGKPAKERMADMRARRAAP